MRVVSIALVVLASGMLVTACNSTSEVPVTPVATPRPTSSSLTTETVYSGTAKSRGALELSGAITAHANVPLTAVDRLEFTVELSPGAQQIDLASGGTPITYIGAVDVVQDVAYRIVEGHAALAPGISARIEIELAGAGITLAPGETFTLEVRPPNGSFLVLQRTLPVVLTPVVQLD